MLRFSHSSLGLRINTTMDTYLATPKKSRIKIQEHKASCEIRSCENNLIFLCLLHPLCTYLLLKIIKLTVGVTHFFLASSHSRKSEAEYLERSCMHLLVKWLRLKLFESMLVSCMHFHFFILMSYFKSNIKARYNSWGQWRCSLFNWKATRKQYWLVWKHLIYTTLIVFIFTISLSSLATNFILFIFWTFSLQFLEPISFLQYHEEVQ